MLHLALLGPPGAGKGTQSKWLVEAYNLVHLAPGDLFREAVKAGTPLGKQVQQRLAQGILLPNALVNELIATKMDAHPYAGGFLFDGYPRTLGQAQALDALLAQRGHALDLALHLEVSEAVLRERIQHRSKVEGRPDDQDPAKLLTRLQYYHQEVASIQGHYQAQGKLVTIDTTPSIPVVADCLREAIDAHQT